MESKDPKEKQPPKVEEAPELRADRDDALGYSREQFDFKPAPAKKTSKQKRSKLHKARRKRPS